MPGKSWLVLIVVLRLCVGLYCNPEVDALIAFKNSLVDNNQELVTWDPTALTPCSWNHVTCNTDNSVNRIDLANTNLSGSLAVQLGQLRNLQVLTLYKNEISEHIPTELGNLTQLISLDLSQNHLSLEIPETLGQLSNLQIFFKNNPDLCGLETQCPGGPPLSLPAVFQRPGANRHSATVAIAGGVIAAAILLLIAIAIIAIWLKRKALPETYIDVPAEENPEIYLGQLRRFSLHELRVASDGFNERNILGRGGFAKVYNGRLLDCSLIAIKRLRDDIRRVGQLQFQSEVEMISMAVHRNLLRLLGFCMTPTELLLVYPYMENGSVASCLHGCAPNKPPLSWHIRKRVALGAAKGIAYLHDSCDPKIIHRDIKAANILLDAEFEAVVGDFGLAKLLNYKDTHVTTFGIHGTIGHIAPEYISTGKVSEKTDVFAYGIMLLELVTGQPALNLTRLANNEDIMLLDWVKKLIDENRVADVVDPDLRNVYDHLELEQVVKVALLCTQSSPFNRPKMSEVVSMLEGDGLAERWEKWQKEEALKIQEVRFDATQDFPWRKFSKNDPLILDSIANLQATELSGPR